MPLDKRFVIVFVVDGLRPDAITAENTPTLHRLRTEGVNFADSHAVFPTVTRVNAAALSTGTQPAPTASSATGCTCPRSIPGAPSTPVTIRI